MTHSLDAYFTAVAGASGALVGLLFVAASISRDEMFGPRASAFNRARASLALTSLVTPLLLALLALIPQIGIRIPAIVAGVSGIVFVVGSIRSISLSKQRHGWRQLTFLVGFLVASVTQLVVGVILQIAPDNSVAETLFAASLVVLVGIGVDRAWELTGGAARSTARSIAQAWHGAQDESGDA